MNVSENLQKLIDASLVDGKISKKERKVLYKRAEKENIDIDEFEIYIDSLKSKAKKNSSGKKNNLVVFGEWLVQKKRRIIFAILVIAVIAGSINDLFLNQAKTERGCDNVEDCLSKFKFEEAREYLSQMSEFNYGRRDAKRNIITAEVSFYLSNDSKDLALRSVTEYNSERAPIYEGRRDGNESYNEDAMWYNNQLTELLDAFKDEPGKINRLLALIKPVFKTKKLISKYKDDDGKECCSHLDLVEFIPDNSKKNQLIKEYNTN